MKQLIHPQVGDIVTKVKEDDVHLVVYKVDLQRRKVMYEINDSGHIIDDFYDCRFQKHYVDNLPCIFVGSWENLANSGIIRSTAYDFLHPQDFSNVTPTESFWHNNPYVVDRFPFERVMVCKDKFFRPLTDYKGLKSLLKKFTSGEVWNKMGEDWVTFQS